MQIRLPEIPPACVEDPATVDVEESAAATACDTMAQALIQESPRPVPQPPAPPQVRRSGWFPFLMGILVCLSAYGLWNLIHPILQSDGAQPLQPQPAPEPVPVLMDSTMRAEPLPDAPPETPPVQPQVDPDPPRVEPMQRAPDATEPAPVETPEPEPLLPPSHIPIRIVSNASGADVFVDGRRAGYVGDTLQLEPMKLHRLRVTSPRHEERTIELFTGDGSAPHADYFVALEAKPSFLRIEAEAPQNFKSPRHAEIWVDGISLGDCEIPYLLERASAGPATVTLRAAGYEPPPDVQVDLDSGATAVATFHLEHLTTILRLHITPPDARVFIGNRRVDPAAIRVIPGLLHNIRITADGHRPMMKDLVLEPGETRDEHLALTPYSHFVITTHPADASLFMDGKRLEDRTVRVKPDTVYFIDARAKGYRPFRGPYQVEEGASLPVHIRMRRKLIPF